MSDHPSDSPTGQYSITDAARRLGISENAVRKRIRRGTLAAHKAGDRWMVAIPGQAATPPPTIPPTPPDQATATPAATTDLAGDLAAAMQPLTDLVADLSRQNLELTEAATMWQIRARQAEERLLALESGEEREDAPVEPSAPHHTPEAPHEGDHSWWRRWWRSLTEGA